MFTKGSASDKGSPGYSWLKSHTGTSFVGLFSSEMLKVGFCQGEDACEGIFMLKWGCFMEKGTWRALASSEQGEVSWGRAAACAGLLQCSQAAGAPALAPHPEGVGGMEVSPFSGRAALWPVCNRVLGLPVSAGLPGLTRNRDVPSFPRYLLPQHREQGREVAQAGGGIFEAMLSALSRRMGLTAGEASAL